ncbi:MAG: hypothetical protein JRN09_05895 [Nitrososphaerota archaeon]|nr:hypothetical protein [Nitrososphaerota archaeon]
MTEPSKAAKPSANASMQFWEFADLGFDTGKKLWFIQFYDETNKGVGSYFANTITMTRGSAAQYQWKDTQGRAFWHVRERFFASEVEGFSVDPSGSITVTFKPTPDAEAAAVPQDFAYLTYAYHLAKKEENQKAPMGFVEFYSSNGDLLRRINNRWIIIEDVGRKTTGEYPKIRLRMERKDVKNIVVTRTAIILQGGQTQ